ncbi:ABC transporter ATP-binding protein [Caldisericum exile]|uniref:ABC transporter n=1 Tax=Caldisericum exile (strain DSM 21853 / NBRC 104410 / AZM16c01) TaxID=511051 RepID=A0A7U6GDC4_CALEA|nr:ABC transporter ATP-binding protein [Caldisericum exile]BAL80260.1 putative ABC transporter [Caldisericum exile AZM16c01]
MHDDLKSYLSLLLHYLKGNWISVTFGVILGIVAEICTLISPLITRYLMDFVIIGKNYSYFKSLILISIFVLMIFLLSSVTGSYVLVKVFKRISANLKLDMFKKLQYAKLSFYEKETSGGISYRLLTDTDSLVDSWMGILVTIPMQLILLVSAVFMVKWNLMLALFTFIILGVQSFVIARFREPILSYTKKVRMKGQEVNGFTVGHFRRIQLVKTISTEELEQKSFFKRLQDLIQLEIKTFMISKFSSVLQTLISNAWSLTILFYGGMLTIYGKMTIGTLMAFMMFANILYQPIASLTNLILSFQSTRVNLMRVKEYLEIEPQISEKPDAIDFTLERGEIKVESVYFSYGDKIVLENVFVDFPPNSITAIVGPTGSGKTTLAKLLVRFFDPDKGKILLDGIDIRDVKVSSLRKEVKLFLSNDYVFNGTLYENITYGAKDVTEERIAWALKMASIDFVQKLPYGLNTVIGEGGINLSAGEAQRVALARALILSPKVYIFDEPTSSVDLETEDKINEVFLKLKQNSTVIIIAHRLSTARIADKILVLENGRINGVGTHIDLLSQNEFYKRVNSILLKESFSG